MKVFLRKARYCIFALWLIDLVYFKCNHLIFFNDNSDNLRGNGGYLPPDDSTPIREPVEKVLLKKCHKICTNILSLLTDSEVAEKLSVQGKSNNT